MAPADPAAIQQAVTASALQAEYGTPVDRESAYERLASRRLGTQAGTVPDGSSAQQPPPVSYPGPQQPGQQQPGLQQPGPQQLDDQGGMGAVFDRILGSSVTRTFARSAATVLGREITRGLLGTARRSGRSRRRR
jgi:uncharacterized protein